MSTDEKKARYLAMRIHQGKLDYDEVIAAFPDLKSLIDDYLAKLGD